MLPGLYILKTSSIVGPVQDAFFSPFRRCRSTYLHPFSVPIINMLPPPNHISSHLNLFQASWVWGQHIPPKHPFRIVIRHFVRTRKSVLLEGNLVSGLTNSCKKVFTKLEGFSPSLQDPSTSPNDFVYRRGFYADFDISVWYNYIMFGVIILCLV